MAARFARDLRPFVSSESRAPLSRPFHCQSRYSCSSPHNSDDLHAQSPQGCAYRADLGPHNQCWNPDTEASGNQCHPPGPLGREFLRRRSAQGRDRQRSAGVLLLHGVDAGAHQPLQIVDSRKRASAGARPVRNPADRAWKNSSGSLYVEVGQVFTGQPTLP